MQICDDMSSNIHIALCEHLLSREKGTHTYVKWFSGHGMDAECLCIACTNERTAGIAIQTSVVCKNCILDFEDQFGSPSKIRGSPGILIRDELFDTGVFETPLPTECREIVDFAAIHHAETSAWLLLSEDGTAFRFDADTLECVQYRGLTLPKEPDSAPWNNCARTPRIHASAAGKFGALVNDFGLHGIIFQTDTGRVTLKLNGSDYHSDTVPLSFAFAEVGGRTVAIHRTAWNRLDISDPGSGELLTKRNLTSYIKGETRPEHYLDYFHGAICVSPNGLHVCDSGWVWHPVGVPSAWSISRWLLQNVWESEDGYTRRDLCWTDYYWNRQMIWIDNERIAIGGLGDEEADTVAGARIFNVSVPLETDVTVANKQAREIISFPGPAGNFFSNGESLFSADKEGLCRWDLCDGARTGYCPSFFPAHFHRGAKELVQLENNILRRLRV